MEAHVVLYEVYTKSLYKIYINFSLQGVNYNTLQNYLTPELVGVLVTLCKSSLFYSIPPVKFQENFFIRPQLLPSKSSPIQHSAIILTIDPTWSELLKASVYKSHTKMLFDQFGWESIVKHIKEQTFILLLLTHDQLFDFIILLGSLYSLWPLNLSSIEIFQLWQCYNNILSVAFKVSAWVPCQVSETQHRLLNLNKYNGRCMHCICSCTDIIPLLVYLYLQCF